jgi:RAB protein geranylgeranyltransferase component A
LIDYIVSSRIHAQLEFLPVGSWWVYSHRVPGTGEEETSTDSEGLPQYGKLLKVPSGREDVFQNQVLDFKAKRALMKFLRFIVDFEAQSEVWEDHRQKPFPHFLSEQFKVPVDLHGPLLALTTSTVSSDHTTTEFALPRIAMHLRSIGVFGPGFGALLPKWGGMSEIVQLACRACAVGGGVYVLGKGVSRAESVEADKTASTGVKTLRLQDGEVITTRWVVEEGSIGVEDGSSMCKSIAIVSSSLKPLFPPLAEDAPSPASAVVVFPSGSLSLEPPVELLDQQLPPVHIFVHSSDTGECPAGQCKFIFQLLQPQLLCLYDESFYEYLSTLSEQS